MAQEENTKAAIDNSDSTEESTYIEDPIEAWRAQEIKRLGELNWTLNCEFIYHPTKEYLVPDLRKFLENYPQVKESIENYISHCLKQLSTHLYDREVIQRYRKKTIELEQQLNDKENGQ